MTETSRQPEPWQARFEEARAAFGRGWSLIALRGKEPLHKGWQRGERAGLEKLLKWLRAGHNLGLRTGSASGVVVIDDDSPDGSASAVLDLPRTVTVVTGSGKRHFYFRAPEFKVRNSVKTLAPAIDLRGDGGQVVFVGSIHPATGKPYEWAPGLSPGEVDLADLPERLLEKLRPAKPQPKTRLKVVRPVPDGADDNDARRARLANYVRAAFDAELDRVYDSFEGHRNDTLNKAAFALGQLVATGALPHDEARTALIHAGVAVGLPEGEASATVDSGLAAGQREPRDLSHVEVGSPPPEGPSDSTEDSEQEDKRPTIKVCAGFLHKVTDQAERILLRQHPPLFYSRGDSLVRVIHRAQATTGRRIHRKPLIQELTLPAVIDHLTRLIQWKRYDAKTDEFVRADCPERVAKTLLSRAGSSRLPPLTGVIDCPTLRADGSLLTTEGYDRPSGIYLSLCGQYFPSVPSEPSRDDALAALAKLDAVIRDFPFVSEADRSVVLAAILTALIRPSLRTAPLFAFVASKMGSGKSLLADVVAMIATGRHASVMSQGADENEDKKRMLPILAEGDPVAVIDNIERAFGSAALCSILTQTTWRDRVLGKSQTLSVPTTNTTWIATGNNVVFEGDITTRTLVCGLDPKCDRPEERRFDVNLHRYIPDHRGELVVAGLTILRAYHVAGRPVMNLPVFGRFEEWSDWVRSALVWLGLADPCLTRTRVEENDPVRAELTQLLAALAKHFGTCSFRVSDVLAAVDDEVRTAIEPLLAGGTKGQSLAQRLGMFFQKVDRRPEGGIRLVRGPSRGSVATWSVEHV